MKRTLLIILTLLSTCTYANDIAMKKVLVQIIAQIDAIMPLIDEAKDNQGGDTRIKFNFDKFKNSKGKITNGLRDDLIAIKQGIVEYINKPDIAPKTIPNLEFDFVEDRG